MDGGLYLVNGGFEFDGKLITDVDEEEIIKVLKQIEKDSVKHVAISGIIVFLFFYLFTKIIITALLHNFDPSSL